MRHLIPDDGAPHAPTTECGCDPYPTMVTDPTDGLVRQAIMHREIDEEFRQKLTKFVEKNDELLRRLAGGAGR